MALEKATAVASKLTDDELMKLAESRGMSVKAAPASSRPIRKPLEEKEQERLKEIFSRYDLDGSGAINLKELQKMFKDLDVELNDEQVAEAMGELDKNGEFTCNFEEFCDFWTSKPGLGGYNKMSLQFMRTGLALKHTMGNMKGGAMNNLSSLAKAKGAAAPDAGEFLVKVGSELSPGMVGCEPKMTIKAEIIKEGAGSEAGDVTSTFVMGATSAEAAEKAVKAIEPCLKMFEDAPFKVAVEQMEHKVAFKVMPPVEMLDQELLEMGMKLSMAAKRAEMKACWSQDFDDVLKAPNQPLRNSIGAASVNAEVACSIGDAMQLIDPEDCGEMPQQMAKKMIGCLAGSEVVLSLGYFEGQVKPLLNVLKKMMTKSYDSDVKQFAKKLPECSLAEFREEIMKMILGEESEGVKTPPSEALAMLEAMRTLPECITGIESLTVSGLPGIGTVKFTMENFNPFPLIAYMLDPLTSAAKMVPKRLLTAGLAKKMTPEEEAKLAEIFKKFDKDDSGQIDVKELKAMTQELGGAMSDQEAEDAIKQLDKNGQGTCNLEEFKEFWTSKPGLGGYSSVALRFLKMKLQVEGYVGKGKRFFSKLRKPVNESDNTTLKLNSAVTPGMEPYAGHKMSLSVAMKDCEGDGEFKPPCSTVKLVALSEEAACKVATDAKSLIEKAQSVGMVPPFVAVPSIEQEGDKVVLRFTPPGEMVEMMQTMAADESMAEKRKMAIDVLKARQDFAVSLGFATSLDDLIESPDTPIPASFKGAQADAKVSITPQGKAAFLKNLPDTGTDTMLVRAILRLFAGAEVKFLQGYQGAAFKEMYPLLPCPPEAVSPGGLRDFICSFVSANMVDELAGMPEYAMPPIHPKEIFNFGQTVLSNMKGVESLTAETFMAANPGDKGNKFEVCVTADNLNIFSAASFVLSPSVKKLVEAAEKIGKGKEEETNEAY